jgi:hypothetical protein
MKPNKGTFWKHEAHDIVWVRFVYQIEGDKFYFLEYTPNNVVPHRGDEQVREEDDEDYPYWKNIEVGEAKSLIVNMDEQDGELSFRMGNMTTIRKLAEALKILDRKRVSSVSVGDTAIRVDTDNGASYEISVTRDGFASRQIGLPDPW